MRLAQIARKVQVKPTEIRSFIKSKFDVELDADPNIKLEDAQVDAILENFKVEEVIEEVKEEVVVEEVVEEDEVDPNVDTDLDALKEVAEEAPVEKIEIPEVAAEEETASEEKEETVAEEKPEKNTVEINYDEDEEPTDIGETEEPTTFDEVPVDHEAAMIAAKVEKLEGLKVVGKIDLGTDDPEPEEVEDLPTAEAVEDEINDLDGDVDTSEFPELGEGESDEKKDAIFAELDAAMDNKGSNKVKAVKKVAAAEVSENIEEEEFSIYKKSNGEYRFTQEQKDNRLKSLAVKEEKARIKAAKEKKKRHYQENVAAKSKPAPKKKTKPSKAAKAKEAKKEAPKGAWQKFLAWLND